MSNRRTTSKTLAGLIWSFAESHALFSYQRDWLRAMWLSPYTAILGGRQIGKDYTLAFFLAYNLAVERGSQWVVLSATNEDAKQLMRDVRLHLEAFKLLARRYECRFPEVDTDNAQLLTTKWNSQVRSVSGTPRGLIGTRGGVIFNEVPMIPEAPDIFPSALSQVRRALELGKKAKLILVGNASYTGSYWHQFIQERRRRLSIGKPGGWTLLTTKWSDARRAVGIPESKIQLERSQIIDDLNDNVDAFNQWFECSFRSPEGSLLDPRILDRQTYRTRSIGSLRSVDQIIGYDVGRVNDPSVFAPISLVGESAYARPTTLLRRTPFPEQREALKALCQEQRTLKVIVDTTGIGLGILDDTKRDLRGIATVKDFTLGAHNHWQLFSRLKSHFESGLLHIPAEDKNLRMQLDSLQTELTAADKIRVKIPKKGLEHSDRAVALALASHGLRAASRYHESALPPISTISNRNSRFNKRR